MSDEIQDPNPENATAAQVQFMPTAGEMALTQQLHGKMNEVRHLLFEMNPNAERLQASIRLTESMMWIELDARGISGFLKAMTPEIVTPDRPANGSGDGVILTPGR